MARKIALALQGGGTHAAFAWGVVDRLLDQVAMGKIEICGVSGASSGALGATALAYGLREGAELPGPAAARGKRMAQAAQAKIEHLWSSIARAAFWGGNPLVATIGLTLGWNIDDSPAARWADMASSGPAPTESGIGTYLTNVLRDVFPHLPAFLAAPMDGVPVLLVAATDIQECRRQVFVDGAVSPAVLKAGMAVPGMNAAAEGEMARYWDGGYMGNPPLTPLLQRVVALGCDDLVVVGGTPLHRPSIPRTPRQVQDRVAEIAFSAALVHEVNAIETLNHLVDSGRIDARSGVKRVNLHRVHADDELARLGIYSKDAPAWDFLVHLRDMGHAAFDDAWPAMEKALGVGSSWDTSALCDHILARGTLAPVP
ncbi:MAG: patatin-like phospholipase family protein [Magnetospirillum gryphiswaldense]|nr:patatin-like phospholipase family protein [Magnetospirillum gryphiswaldense]